MSLVITVSKSEVREPDLLSESRRALFEKITENSGQFLFVPMPGKLADILKLLTENKIAYHVSNSAHELSISDQTNT